MRSKVERPETHNPEHLSYPCDSVVVVQVGGGGGGAYTMRKTRRNGKDDSTRVGIDTAVDLVAHSVDVAREGRCEQVR